MRIFRILLTLTLLTAFANTGFSQKLKSDGFKLSFKSFEKREMGFCGKKKEIYAGIVKVKSKDSLKGVYRFYFPKIDDKINILTILDNQKKVLKPRLYFDEEIKTFVYYQGTDKEGKEKLSDDISVEEIVLSGMLIWLRIKK